MSTYFCCENDLNCISVSYFTIRRFDIWSSLALLPNCTFHFPNIFYSKIFIEFVLRTHWKFPLVVKIRMLGFSKGMYNGGNKILPGGEVPSGLEITFEVNMPIWVSKSTYSKSTNTNPRSICQKTHVKCEFSKFCLFLDSVWISLWRVLKGFYRNTVNFNFRIMCEIWPCRKILIAGTLFTYLSRFSLMYTRGPKRVLFTYTPYTYVLY